MNNLYEINISESGFTLVELLVSMAIVSILLAAAGSIFYSLNKSMSGENARVALQQGVRAAVNLIAIDLRHTGLDAHNKKKFFIKNAKRSEVTFSSDINMDGELDNNETFTYMLSSPDGELMIADNAKTAPQPLLSHVKDLQFRYFRDNDVEIPFSGSGATAAITDTDEIRAVEIYLSAEEKYWGGSSTEKRSYRTLVRCRNLNRL